MVIFTIQSFGSIVAALLSLNFLTFFFVVTWCNTKLKGESAGVLPDWAVCLCLVWMLPVYNWPWLLVDIVFTCTSSTHYRSRSHLYHVRS
jgi:hypothetical protein